MRPLSSTSKTAIFFFAIYTGLILISNFWMPVNKVMAPIGESNSLIMTLDFIDLKPKVIELKTKWQQELEKAGFKNPINLSKVYEEKMMVREIGKVHLEWLQFKNTLILPTTSSEKNLIRLCSMWKELTEAQSFTVASIKLGRSNGTIWVKLTSAAHIQYRVNQKVEVRIAEIIIIQPEINNNIIGLLPVIPPTLKSGDNLDSLIRTCLNPRTEQKKLELKTANPSFHKRAIVSLIIDDVGFVTKPADELLQIPVPLTWAILPDAPYTQKYAELAKEHGFEILLHLPLEPINPQENPGPGVIKREWPEAEIASQLDKDLTQVPEAVGINNHMGSAGTSDEKFMQSLMVNIKRHQVFFVDSFTIAGSVAEKYARLYQIPFAKRKVFIDNEQSIQSKEKALRLLIKIALRDGEAIGIAHVREGTAQAILNMIPEFIKAGVEIVPVSKLVK